MAPVVRILACKSTKVLSANRRALCLAGPILQTEGTEREGGTKRTCQIYFVLVDTRYRRCICALQIISSGQLMEFPTRVRMDRNKLLN